MVLLSLSEREGYLNLGYGNFIPLQWRKQWNRIGANTISVNTRARTGFTRSRVSHLRPYCLERSRNFVYSISLQLQTRRDELKARGESLFNEYQHPRETRLALEIKEFDDQVAECVQQLGRRTQGSSEQ
jgi:hypothetical protein